MQEVTQFLAHHVRIDELLYVERDAGSPIGYRLWFGKAGEPLRHIAWDRNLMAHPYPKAWGICTTWWYVQLFGDRTGEDQLNVRCSGTRLDPAEFSIEPSLLGPIVTPLPGTVYPPAEPQKVRVLTPLQRVLKRLGVRSWL